MQFCIDENCKEACRMATALSFRRFTFFSNMWQCVVYVEDIKVLDIGLVATCTLMCFILAENYFETHTHTHIPI